MATKKGPESQGAQRCTKGYKNKLVRELPVVLELQ